MDHQTQIVVVGAGRADTPRRFMPPISAKKSSWSSARNGFGGVCLNRGCIPSKGAALRDAQITAARDSEHRGITFTPPTVDLPEAARVKESILEKLGGGVATLAKMRGVQ